jgi:hypothetical protein
MGLNAGTRLVVHDLGATRADPATSIATLRVLDVTATSALAEIEEGAITTADSVLCRRPADFVGARGVLGAGHERR